MANQEERYKSTGDKAAQTTSWEEFERTGSAKGEYTFRIKGFDDELTSKKKGDSIASDECDVAACSWNLLVFPQGSLNAPIKGAPFVSVFLKLVNSHNLPESDRPHSRFKLILLNRRYPDKSIAKEAEHRFNQREDDWGFSEFVPTEDLKKEEHFPDGSLHIRVEMQVSLEEEATGQRTGFLRLRNETSTDRNAPTAAPQHAQPPCDQNAAKAAPQEAPCQEEAPNSAPQQPLCAQDLPDWVLVHTPERLEGSGSIHASQDLALEQPQLDLDSWVSVSPTQLLDRSAMAASPDPAPGTFSPPDSCPPVDGQENTVKAPRTEECA